jgi:hypothetical protein
METRLLPCKLTEEELIDRAHRLERCLQGVKEIEAAKKAYNDGVKKELSEAEIEINKYAWMVREEKELREVEIVEEKDYKRKVSETIRRDTGEVIETRTLDPRELQTESTVLTMATK